MVELLDHDPGIRCSAPLVKYIRNWMEFSIAGIPTEMPRIPKSAERFGNLEAKSVSMSSIANRASICLG